MLIQLGFLLNKALKKYPRIKEEYELFNQKYKDKFIYVNLPSYGKSCWSKKFSWKKTLHGYLWTIGVHNWY